MDVIGIIGVLLTLWMIKLQFFSKPNESMQHLFVQFKATQQLSLQVQRELEEFCIKYDYWDYEIYPGITCRTYLEEMKSSFDCYLSDDLLARTKSLSPSKTNIDAMTKSLATQFDALSMVRTQLSLFRRELERRS